MIAPTLSYLLTWIALSFWYFAYWNQYPRYSLLLATIGTAIIIVELIGLAFFPLPKE